MMSTRLGDIAMSTSGNAAPQDKKLFVGGTHPFVRTGDVGRVHLDSCFTHPEDYLNEEGIRKMKLFPKGSILFPKSGASTLLNHRVLLGEDSYVVSHLAVIIPNNTKVLSKYLYYATVKIDAGDLVDDRAYPSLKTSVLENVKINLPSIEKQQEIVLELDLLSDIIKSKRQQINDLDALTLSIFVDMFGDPVSNEKKWDSKPLKDVCERLYAGGDVPKESLSKNKDKEHIYPIFSNGKGDSALYGYTGTPRETSPAITISGRGTIGYSCIRNEPFFPIIRLIVAVPAKSSNIVFLQKHISLMTFESTGGAIPQLTIPMIKDRNIILPPLELQNEYAQKIEAIERRMNMIKQSLCEIETLFSSRMDCWFS